MLKYIVVMLIASHALDSKGGGWVDAVLKSKHAKSVIKKAGRMRYTRPTSIVKAIDPRSASRGGFLLFNPYSNDGSDALEQQEVAAENKMQVKLYQLYNQRDFAGAVKLVYQFNQQWQNRHEDVASPEILAGLNSLAYRDAMVMMSNFVQQHPKSDLDPSVGLPACAVSAMNGEYYNGQASYCAQQLRRYYWNDPGYDDSWITEDPKSVGVAALVGIGAFSSPIHFMERAVRLDPTNAFAKRELLYTIEASRKYAVGIGSIDALLPLFPSGPDHDLFTQKRQQFVDAAAKETADALKAQPQP
jgi:hypothetical protein